MNEDQRQQLVDLIDKLESEGLSKKEIQSQVDIKKQDFNTENNLGKTLPSQPEEVAIVEENVATNMDSNLENGSLELFADNTKNQSIQELKNLVDELSAQGLSNPEIQIRVDKEKEKRVNARLVKENKKQTSIQAIDNRLNSTKKEEDEEIKYESAPQYIYENIVDFVGDIGDAWNNGMLQGEQTDRGIELAGFFGDPANEEELDAFVNGQKEVAQKTIQSAEMREFDKIYEEAGGGWWGFLKGAAYNPSLLTTMLTSSVASQLSSIKNSEEVAMAATAGALTGSLAGPIGTVVGITTGSMAMMEAGLTFNELLMEEIGGDINDPKVKDKIRAVLNDPEKMSDLRKRAGMRGAAIAGVELATLGIAKGLAGRLASKGLAKAGLLAGGATEIVGGGLGEVAGRAVAGQEMDAKEIGFEAFAGLGSAPLSLGSAALNLQTAIQTSEIGKTVRDSDYKSISDVYSDKNSNSTTAIDISKKSKSTKIVDREVNEKVKLGKLTKEEGDKVKNNFRATQGAVNQVKSLNFNTEQETKAVELLKEKNKLINQIKEVNDTALTGIEQERVDAINKELGNLNVERASQTVAEAIDPSRIIVVENAKELQDKYNIKDVGNKQYSKAGGFFENGKLYINKEKAGTIDIVTEAGHELLHPVLKEALKADLPGLVGQFKEVIGPELTAEVDAIIEENPVYNTDYMKANPDEFITQFFDLSLDTKRKSVYNDNFLTKIGDFITPLLRKFGFKKIKFDTGKDVYNFMREYSRNIKEGKLSEDVKAVIPKNLKTNANESTQETDTNTALSVKKATVLEDINKLVPQDITTQEEYKSFLNDPRAFPKLYNAINNQGGVINNYIRSISTSQAETEKTIENLTNRILKFNPETKRADNTAVGIEAFGERVFADVQFAKLGSKKELFQESEKTKQESRIEDREDGFEVATETEAEVEVAKTTSTKATRYKELKNSFLPSNVKTKFENFVSTMIGKLKPENFTFKNLPNFGKLAMVEAIGIVPTVPFKELVKGSTRQIGTYQRLLKASIDDLINQGVINANVKNVDVSNRIELQKVLGNDLDTVIENADFLYKIDKLRDKANFTQLELDKIITYLEKNLSDIKLGLPGAAVLEGSKADTKLFGTSTGVAKNLLQDKNLYEKLDRGTRKSGLAAFKKLKGIDPSSIRKAMGIVNEQRTAGTQSKAAQTIKGLINAMANVITNQEVRAQLSVENPIINVTENQLRDTRAGGIDNETLFSFNTRGKGTWVPDLQNPLSGDKFYNFNVAGTWFRISSFNNDEFNYDILEETFGIKEGAFANDINSKSIAFYDLEEDTTEITGKMGMKDSIKVFSIVANSIIDLIKKDNLNSITFTAKEPSRQKLYEAMVQKFQKELGWESYDLDLNTPEGVEAGFVVYDPKFFINEEKLTAFSAKIITPEEKETLIKTTKSLIEVGNYKNLETDIFQNIENGIENLKIKTWGDALNFIKNVFTNTLPTLAAKRQFEFAILNDLYKGVTENNIKDKLIKSFLTYRKIFKYEQVVIGYNYSLQKLKKDFAGDKENKIKAVKRYLRLVSRSTKTLGIDGMKTNQAVFEKLSNELGKDKLEKLGFGIKIVKDKKGKTKSYVTFKENTNTPTNLEGLLDITELKKNPGKFVDIIAAQSKEVLDYYIELIEEAKTLNELEQVKAFIALTSADQRGMLRKLSTLGFAIKDFKGEKSILEHQTTALELFNKLIDFVDEIKNVDETELRSFVAQAKINLVPKSFANLLDSQKVENGNARYEAPAVVKIFNKEKKAGNVETFASMSVKNIKLVPLINSKNKAAFKNNKALPKSEQINEPNSWWKSDMVNSEPSQMVLDRLKEVDNKNNEARAAFSVKQNLDDDFNKIIEAKTGIKTYKRFDRAGATVKGASKGKFNFFIPPSAEDFVGLLYKTLARGKVGDIQMQWFKDNLINPYARAMNDVSAARVAMFEDYKTLKNDLKIIPKDLKKKSFDEYTREQAVRVYIWDQQGNKIPGIFKTNQQSLVDYVNNNAELKAFADQLVAIQKGDQYSSPNEGWLAGSITTDLLDSVNSIKRKKYLEQWQTNVDEIFGETNMNKLEAAFGKPYREALTNILTRMKTGRNKPFTSDSLAGRFTNWLNNSVGAIMFFNTRSAVLQLLSSINFVNFTDNNPLKAGAAFANQPQYWKDFKFLFNSDFLKERRGGLRFNVSESEIADAAQKGGAKGVISKILQAGFLPTQMADSFAIATGGATFYRNRVKTYTKQGLTEAEANEKAFQDFRETAEESQQSSRPDRISAQQAGPLGRTILAFANTPAQYARLTKKAASDIINGRGDLKTNLSKLAYYGAVQNLIFNFLQQAVFALAFGDESDEEEKKKEEKLLGVANGMADSFLRGIGVAGAITATLKNALIKIIKEDQKARPDYAETTVIQLLGISPPVQSKAQKIRSALKSYEWNKDEMKEKGFSLDNPAYLAGANVISAGFNVPLDRVVKKVDNIKNSTQDDISTLNRIMLLAGWSDWQLDIQKEKPKKSKNSRVKIRKSSSRTGKRKVTTR